MENMRVSQSDREFFVRLLAEYGLARGGVKNAVGIFLEFKDWKDTRANRVRLLSRMRVCNPNYPQCRPEWREYYDKCRAELRSGTAERHLTRALARDRHMESVFRQILTDIDRLKGKARTDMVRAFTELIKTELEVERHERGSVRDGVSQSDTGTVRQDEPAGSGGVVRELISALESLGDGQDDV